MSSMDEKRCSVYIRVYLGSEKDRMYAKGDVLPLFGKPKETGKDIRWALLFVFEEKCGLRFEASLRNKAVLLGLSHVSADQFRKWEDNKELVKIPHGVTSRDYVFQAFERVAPRSKLTDQAGKCNIWVMKLLREMHITVPNQEQVESMAAGDKMDGSHGAGAVEKSCRIIRRLPAWVCQFIKSDDPIDLEQYREELRRLLGDICVSDSLPEPRTDGECADNTTNELVEKTPVTGKRRMSPTSGSANSLKDLVSNAINWIANTDTCNAQSDSTYVTSSYCNVSASQVEDVDRRNDAVIDQTRNTPAHQVSLDALHRGM